MKKILVIDDDPPFCATLALTLARQGYRVFSAHDATTGFTLATTHQPDLILSDVNMAGQSGFELLNELRVHPATSAIQVVLMTGDQFKASLRLSMDRGADDYLQKPFTMPQMLAAVHARLQRQDATNLAVAAQSLPERERTEQKLHLLTSALESAANGIAITQSDGIILWVNSAFTKLTGYTAEEAVGQNPRFMKSGEHPPQFYADLWATINAGQVWQGEIFNRRKDGQVYCEEMTITPVRDAAGDIQNFIAIKQDISARKQSEQVLKSERDLLQALMNNLPDHIYFKDASSCFTRINQAHARHLGLAHPDAAAGKSDADFFSLRDARQKLVDERRLLATGEPILGLVERSETNGESRWVSSTKVPLYGADGEITGLVGISHDITKRMRAEESLRLLSSAVEQSKESILITDAELTLPGPRILFVNPAFTQMTGYAAAEVIGQTPRILQGPRTDKAMLSRLRECLERGEEFAGIGINYRKDGTEFFLEWQIAPISDAAGKVTHFVAIQRDITERKRIEAHLAQSQKLETVGQLAAGIAHEINTPTQYVGDNTRFVKDSFAAILKVLQSHEELVAAAKQNAVTPELLKRSEALLVASDLEYLTEQIPVALEETLEGIERVSKIVRAMKEFSHPGGQEKTAADLNRAIESTVTVARNEWRYVAEMKLELAPELPPVPCFIGEFNQCILNLIVNAAHAIGDVVGKNPGTKGCITVQTRCAGDSVEVRVTDTGTGIPEAARPKIFAPFFTTKEVGKGTGQGLSIVYGSIVKRHGGTATFETEIGHGTTFILRLPWKDKIAVEEKGAGLLEKCGG